MFCIGILAPEPRGKSSKMCFGHQLFKICVPPADTAALFCFTNARVVSTIILFCCGRMAPTYSKRLGLKHATVNGSLSQHNDSSIHNTYECDCEYVLTKHYCGHQILVGGNCMGNNDYRRKEEESKRMYYLGEEKKS